LAGFLESINYTAWKKTDTSRLNAVHEEEAGMKIIDHWQAYDLNVIVISILYLYIFVCFRPLSLSSANSSRPFEMAASLCTRSL
jgi:hypothetical protein